MRNLLIGAAVIIAAMMWAAREPKGDGRFVDTFTWQLLLGHQATTFDRKGGVRYVMVVPEDNGATSSDTVRGTYRIAGDTAVVELNFPARAADPDDPDDEPEEASIDSLHLVMKQGNLLLLDGPFGSNPTFYR